MSTDEANDRSDREEDAKRAGLFAVLLGVTNLLIGAFNGENGPLVWLGLVFLFVGVYYTTKRTFQLRSEDRPDYEG